MMWTAWSRKGKCRAVFCRHDVECAMALGAERFVQSRAGCGEVVVVAPQ